MALLSFLQSAGLEHLNDVVSGKTLDELLMLMKSEGRVALLAHLKEAGVSKLGDRQKLANALSKAERLANAEPATTDDKVEPKASSAAAAKSVAGGPEASSAAAATSWTAKVDEWKARGNEAFKAQRNREAVDAWSEALKAAKKAANQTSSQLEDRTLQETIVKLKTNMAAAYLKLEQWVEANACADSALEVEPKNTKALFRRGMARKHLQDAAGAKKDLLMCVKLDPKNKEAREALAGLGVKEASAKEAPPAPASEPSSNAAPAAAKARSYGSYVTDDGIEHISTETMRTESEWKKMMSGGGG